MINKSHNVVRVDDNVNYFCTLRVILVGVDFKKDICMVTYLN